MNFIIDANNLAGSLDLLGEADFDQQLSQIVEDWLGDKQKIVVLVFDSLDPLGDRITRGYLEIIYSPRDGYYKTADDKIIEIFREWSRAQKGKTDYSLNIIKRLAKDDLVFVSDDRDLLERIEELREEISENIRIISNEKFMRMMERKEIIEDEYEIDEDRGLAESEIEDIKSRLTQTMAIILSNISIIFI